MGTRPGVDWVTALESAAVDEPADRGPQGDLPQSVPASAARRSSSLGTNVLTFVAFLAVLMVVIYAMNKGKPKESTMFSAPPPPPPTASADTTTPANAAPITGRLEVPETVSVPASAVVFLTARPSGVPAQGPPLAVKRLEANAFPLAFSIGAGDVMIPGRPWRGPVDLTARLDQDGDALTRTPGDLETQTPVRGVELGQSGVRVILAESEGS
ncbi:MAG: hypothetical protein ACFB9M_08075 [Myxococcota bacterium]